MFVPDTIPLEEREHFAVDFGDNESVLFRIHYIGDEASGIVDIASTGDITFKHGDLSSEAADDDTKIESGGSGVLDLSADVTDYHSLIRHINSFDNWEAWPVGALPDDDPHTTTTGHFTEVTGGSASGANGYAVKTDDSDSLYIVAGMTFNGPAANVHATDAQALHALQRVIALSTYATGSSALKAYACDDLAGSSEEIASWKTGATTVEVAYPAETYPAGPPIAWTKGKRLAVKLVNSAALGTVRLLAQGFSYKFGPSVRDSKQWAEQCQ